MRGVSKPITGALVANNATCKQCISRGSQLIPVLSSGLKMLWLRSAVRTETWEHSFRHFSSELKFVTQRKRGMEDVSYWWNIVTCGWEEGIFPGGFCLTVRALMAN